MSEENASTEGDVGVCVRKSGRVREKRSRGGGRAVWAGGRQPGLGGCLEMGERGPGGGAAVGASSARQAGGEGSRSHLDSEEEGGERGVGMARSASSRLKCKKQWAPAPRQGRRCRGRARLAPALSLAFGGAVVVGLQGGCWRPRRGQRQGCRVVCGGRGLPRGPPRCEG